MDSLFPVVGPAISTFANKELLNEPIQVCTEAARFPAASVLTASSGRVCLCLSVPMACH